jgi:hypothetical protein
MAKKTPAKKKTSTALARRPAPRKHYPGASLMAPSQVVRNVQVLPPEAVARYGQLTETMELGVLGLAEVKLTSHEEAVLSRPVNIADIRVKPDGIAYLSHPTYTKWFNDAFGRLGWALVPCSQPKVMDGRLVVVPYVLYIHGKPVAFAMGEQEYNPSNKRQSYGDAFEATVASALRRNAKHLGVGLEMWDKPFLADYLAHECVLVKVNGKDGIERQWRRRQDRALPGEIGAAETGEQATAGGDWRAERPQRPAQSPSRPQNDAGGSSQAPTRASGQPISEKQAKRLYAIVTNSGRNMDLVKKWVKARYGYEHFDEIARNQYDEICQAVEAEGNLP